MLALALTLAHLAGLIGNPRLEPGPSIPMENQTTTSSARPPSLCSDGKRHKYYVDCLRFVAWTPKLKIVTRGTPSYTHSHSGSPRQVTLQDAASHLRSLDWWF